MATIREVWEAAQQRLIRRYLAEHPGTDWSKAAAIISGNHEAIGAEMDTITGGPPFDRKGRLT